MIQHIQLPTGTILISFRYFFTIQAEYKLSTLISNYLKIVIPDNQSKMPNSQVGENQVGDYLLN